MGCDIHFYVEKLVPNLLPDSDSSFFKWETADTWELEDSGLSVDYHKRFYTGRNYELFSILAGVRNRSGLAPISDPRGVPDDVCSQVRCAYDGWGGDAHSPSWFTLRELLDFDWTQFAILSGVVSGVELYKWNRWGRKQGRPPESYCQSVGGGTTVYSTDAVLSAKTERYAQELLAKNSASSDCRQDDFDATMRAEFGHQYTSVVWKEFYYGMAGSFWSETIPRLLRVGKPTEVRIVFWFDN